MRNAAERDLGLCVCVSSNPELSCDSADRNVVRISRNCFYHKHLHTCTEVLITLLIDSQCFIDHVPARWRSKWWLIGRGLPVWLLRQTGYWPPQVKGQIAEIHIFDWQQFKSVSLCNFDSYQFEATQPADLGPEISQDPVNRGRQLCCCDSGIYYHTSFEWVEQVALQTRLNKAAGDGTTHPCPSFERIQDKLLQCWKRFSFDGTVTKNGGFYMSSWWLQIHSVCYQFTKT